MSLKRLVNDKPLWDDFVEELEQRIQNNYKTMSQSSDTACIFRMQGQVAALQSLKQLREKINNG